MKLSNNFDSIEFTCRCGCGVCNVDSKFLKKLQRTREIADIRFDVSSGCRCASHNKKEGGEFNSDHLTTESVPCKGCDIICYTSGDRYKIVKAAILAGFTRIGMSKHKSFIHLGENPENPQDVLWLY